MKIEDVKTEALRRADDNELQIMRLRFIQLYNKNFFGNDRVEAGTLRRSDLLDKYQLLVREIKHRDLTYNSDRPIDRAVFRKSMFGIDVRDLGDLVIVLDYMNIGGSFVENPIAAADVDIIIRDSPDNRDEGLELKVGRTVKTKTGKDAHFVYAPRGPHSTYVPMFDLVLRGKPKMERVAVAEKRVWKAGADKGPEYYEALDDWDIQLLEDNWNVVLNMAEGSVLDLGCGTGRLMKTLQQSGVKAAGIDNDRVALRYCRKRGLDVQDLDLETAPLPYDSNSWDNVVMVHSLEHVKNADRLLREAERVAKKRVVLLVPLGKRYDPTHVHRFDTKADLAKMLAGEPHYHIHEIERSHCAVAIFDKRLRKARSLTPFGRYDPPKPTMAGITEAYSVDEISNWAKGRSLVVEPKLNGFRMVLAKEGDTVKIMSENRDNHASKYPDVVHVLKKIPGDFLLDASMGIERAGKPLPRIELMTLLAAKPDLESNDKIVATVFDLPFVGEDLHDKPFSERRKILEDFYNKHLKYSPNFDITRSVAVSSLAELQAKFKEFAKLPMSEGVVIKDVNSKWSLDGSEPDWAKLKVEAEIKVQVLEAHSVSGGKHVYTCGVLLGDAEYSNTKEVGGSQLVVLGKTFSTDISAGPGDVLTVGVEEIIPREGKLVWLGPRVLDKDSGRKQPYTAGQAEDVARRANILQKAEYSCECIECGHRMQSDEHCKDLKCPKCGGIMRRRERPGPGQMAKRGPLRGVYVAKPQASEALDSGRLVLPQKLSSGYVGKDVYLVEDKHVLAVVRLIYSGREAFKAAYDLEVVDRFEPPVGYDPPPGVKNTIREIILEKAEREGAAAAEGNIDFAAGTKGTGVLQAHIMGIEEDKVDALRQESTRLLIARYTPAKLEAALKSAIGEQGVHCDLRLRPAGKDYWEGGEIMVGNTSGISKLDKLRQQNQKLRFGWKVSRAGEQQQSVVRGPLSWMEAGKRKIEVYEPGDVGATANKYGALVNLDTFNWELYSSDEHAKKFRFTGGKLLDGNFLFAYVPVAEGERVWMMSRLNDTDHQEMAKAAAIEPQECRHCVEPAVRSHILEDGTFIPVCEEHNMRALLMVKNEGGRVIRTVQIPVPIEKLNPAQRKECDEETERIRESAKMCVYPHKFKPAKYTHKNGHPRCSICGQEEDVSGICRKPVEKALRFEFRIFKKLKTKQIVGGVVYEPDVVDSQGDITSEEEIQGAMYRFMEKYAKSSRRIKVQHEGKAHAFPILECFQPEHDITRGGQTVKKGSWWLMLKVTDSGVWKLIEDGKITAFSMGGMAHSDRPPEK